MTQVGFAHDGATLLLLSGSKDGTTRYWDVERWEAKAGEEVAMVLEGSKFVLSKENSFTYPLEQKVGKHLITATDDILLISKSEGNTKEKNKEAPVAFFRAPGKISAVDTCGAHIAVRCENGEVLQLRAAVLLT